MLDGSWLHFGRQAQTHAAVGNGTGDFGFLPMGARHENSGASLDFHAYRNAIDLSQLLFGSACLLGCLRHSHRFGRNPDSPACQPPVSHSVKVLFEDADAVVWQQDMRRNRGNDERPVRSRVQSLEIVHTDTGQLCGNSCVHVTADRHLFKIRAVGHIWQRRAEHCRTAHNILDGLELGHIFPCFCGHGQVFIARSEARSPVACNGALHVALTPVVGCQRQMPVAKHGVKPLQVIERGPGRAHHVAPLVAKGVLGE